MIGRVLDGRYEIKERIGIGAAGVVYRAGQTRVHGRDVAIKILNFSAAANSVSVRRFEQEARIIAELRHPNTLKLIDFGRSEDGRLFLVTEFLEGVSLDRILSDSGRVSTRRMLRILRQTCDSLGEAHSLGIVHRDLKPPNIFLERVGDQEIVKVLDFGLAKELQGTDITQPLFVCGTPGYMSPEQLRGEPIDPRSDFYSLGAIAYESLSGRPVFRAKTAQELLQRHVRDTPRPLQDLVREVEVARPVCEFVMRLLSKQPNARPQNVAEVKLQLDELLRDAGVAAPQVAVMDMTPVVPNAIPAPFGDHEPTQIASGGEVPFSLSSSSSDAAPRPKLLSSSSDENLFMERTLRDSGPTPWAPAKIAAMTVATISRDPPTQPDFDPNRRDTVEITPRATNPARPAAVTPAPDTAQPAAPAAPAELERRNRAMFLFGLIAGTLLVAAFVIGRCAS
jgi:serine/threonine protein kinase